MAPARPEGFGNQAVTTPDTLEFNNGDKLSVDMHDTAAGFQVVIHDLTTGQSGSMTASVANRLRPCALPTRPRRPAPGRLRLPPHVQHLDPETRVLWAAHSYNVAFSDEIGHFEYCNAVNSFGGSCKAASFPDATDPTRDNDDRSCFPYPVVNPVGTTIAR